MQQHADWFGRFSAAMTCSVFLAPSVNGSVHGESTDSGMRKYNPSYNPKVTDIFDSLTAQEREELRLMLDHGLTEEAATQLLDEGIREEASSGSSAVTGLPIRLTQSAREDLEWFGTGRCRHALESVLGNLGTLSEANKCRRLPGGRGWWLRDGPFRVVFKTGEAERDTVVVAIAPAGINPIKKVWRYFDQFKGEDLLKKGCLYFRRLDQLTGDPFEARLPQVSKEARTWGARPAFGDHAGTIVDEREERLRGTTYVCCWTRRDHESYLAWKHYCSREDGRPGGGFAVQSTWRRISHLHSALRADDDQILLRAVGYLDPLADELPTSDEGEQVFWKAHWFSDETEIRLAALRTQFGSHPEIKERILKTLPHGEHIRCDLKLLIQEIVVNPFASPEQRARLQEILSTFQPELASRVRESAIVVENSTWPQSANSALAR